MQQPPFPKRQLSSLIDFICKYWRYPVAVSAPITRSDRNV